MDNCLYYGDNLDILRRYIKDESVDLIYLDPPFNSKANYNMLFKEHNGEQSAAQFQAFEDTWTWDKSSAAAYQDVVERGEKISKALIAYRSMLGDTDMLAYLAMMSERLIELHRVLKSTGSLYLHCDPTASHYLKLILDAVFGPVNFRNEIIWRRTGAHGRAKRWGPIHDVILFYSKSADYTWNRVYQKYGEDYVEDFYRLEDSYGKYQIISLDEPGVRKGSSGQPWKGVDPTPKGRHWELPPDRALPPWFEHPEGYPEMTVQERLSVLEKAGFIYWPPAGHVPRFKRYLMVAEGNSVQDVIWDISPIGAQAAERLGYPTQKPLALLERIIQASSNPGEIVLDPFAGCGTCIEASQKLEREWIGVDITHLAITLIKKRLKDAYGSAAKFKVIGEPTSLRDAEALAISDPYQFQWWALGLVGARPVEEKKGADKGIDGRLYFHEQDGGETKQVIFSVKAGNTNAAHMRDLHGVIDREGAAIGVLLTMQEPTKPMRSEAASGGIYTSPWGNHPKLQILTVEELLEGKKIDMPPVHQVNVTYKRASKSVKKGGNQPDLLTFKGD